MLLRVLPEDDNEKLRREYARDKGASPYMYVYAILFAFTIQSLAGWLHEQITLDLKPGRAPLTVADNLLSPVPYLLIALLFLYSVYFWLFFSRVLVYIEENSFGEFLSFLLAGVVLGVVSTIRQFFPVWPFLVAIPHLSSV